MADEKGPKARYFSMLSNAEQSARAAARVGRELPNFYQEPAVAAEAQNLQRAYDLHVKPNLGIIETHAKRVSIDPRLLQAVIAVEQRGNTTPGKYVQSDKGAAGIAQLMPLVRETYKVNPRSVEDSIRGAADYLADMQKKFGDSFPALGIAYHSGETNLRRFNQQQEMIGPEGRAYAAFMAIMDDKLRGGEKATSFLDNTNQTEKLRQTLKE